MTAVLHLSTLLKASLARWARVEINQPMTIGQFTGEYRWLSNFWAVRVEHQGMVFPTVEHAFQAAKTRRVPERRWIADSATPAQARQRGKMIGLRKDWDVVKLQVMEELLRIKFRDPALRRRLVLTRNYQLIEGNGWGDVYWGQCNGKGANHLGVLLMKVRGELQKAVRVIVAGSRPPQEVRANEKLLGQWYLRHKNDVRTAAGEFEQTFGVKIGAVISGGTVGYDRLGEYFARENVGVEPEVFKPDWDKYGRAAGMLRNERMVIDGFAEGLVACWDRSSIGTRNMIELAKGAGLFVHVRHIQQ